MPHSDWTYDTAADLDQTLSERLKSYPREPDMSVYAMRMVAAGVIRMWLRIYHRFSVTGREHIPAETPYVIVANHTSHLDTLSILSTFRVGQLHTIFPAAAADYFFSNVPKSVFSGIVINALPFHRQSGGRKSLEICRQLLTDGNSALLIFPEGTRTTTGKLGQFKPGTANLVAGTDVPVVPCRIHGGHEAWPKGAKLPRPGKVTIAFGAPLVFSDLDTDKESILAISDSLHDAVAAL